MMGIYFLWRLSIVIIALTIFALFVFIYGKVIKLIRKVQRHDIQVYERRDI